MNDNYQPVDDDIDLYSILRTLWKARWAILISTLSFSVIAFVYSYWFIAKEYQATATVLINQPAISYPHAPSESGPNYSPTIPDLKTAVELFTNSSLLKNVLENPEVAASISSEEISVNTLKSMATAVAVGKDQVNLKISGSDPQIVALLANTWAEKVAEFINDTYGLGSVVKELDLQVLSSQKEYEQAQLTLEQALYESQVSALNSQLESMKLDLNIILRDISSSERVLDDLQFFDQGLANVPNETPLSLGDGLALTTLRQRSLTAGNTNYTVQIDSSSFSRFTVSQALEATSQMRTGLQSQIKSLQNDQTRLEQEIPKLISELENATALNREYIRGSDLTYKIYSDLLMQKQEIITVLGLNSGLAKITVQAVPPNQPVPQRFLMNTALVGFLGLILSIFSVLTVEWWKRERGKSQD